ncbi:MarR family winged helix-turn-helix transcriptional regulator [Megalodesulfovibrio gigas]|uniref:MarR family winged helix-turn-helix transcriptional regulator n=1 Tax=Megalodesulfovibrio gigas TaxID=879 RepID=UPI0003FB5C10|nr:MarR family winged helix-turn-helix transcriptional regulator [Megalodesulfovibrio gigas]
MPSSTSFVRRPPGQSMGRLICLVNRRFQLYALREMARLQIGQGQVLLMAELFHQHATGTALFSQDELAALLKVDKATVTRAMAPLERVGYVVRSADLEDRRIRRVQLTPKALAIESEFFAILYRWSDALLDGIPQDKQSELFGLLRMVLANADRMAEGPRRELVADDEQTGDAGAPA